jgi:hypothetical protein
VRSVNVERVILWPTSRPYRLYPTPRVFPTMYPAVASTFESQKGLVDGFSFSQRPVVRAHQ